VKFNCLTFCFDSILLLRAEAIIDSILLDPAFENLGRDGSERDTPAEPRSAIWTWTSREGEATTLVGEARERMTAKQIRDPNRRTRERRQLATAMRVEVVK
jgi:hypothetical protein